MSKKIKWYREGSKADGWIYFKKHLVRKNGVKFDKYFRTEYQTKGKRVAINFGWETEGWSVSRCQEKLKIYKTNAKKGSGPISLREERKAEENKKRIESKKNEIDTLTFGDFFQNIYKPTSVTNKKPGSFCKEIEHFKNWLKPEIGHLPFKKITAFNLEKVKKKMLDKGRAPRTIQYVFATFRQVWNYARLNDVVGGDSPTKKIKLPKIENKRLRFLSHNEAAKLLKALKNKSKQVHDMALFSLHTGCRAKEIFDLTWGVIDFDNRSIQIRDSKGRTRHVYLTEATKQMLQGLYQGQPACDLVFKNAQGKRLREMSKLYSRIVNELEFNSGVTDRRDRVLFHTLRHSFASWHVQNGTDLYTVKELLGHSTIQLTERYSHLRPDGLKKAAQNFDEKVIKNNIIPLEKTEQA